MTSPNELYLMPPKSVSGSLAMLSSHHRNHLPELGDDFRYRTTLLDSWRIEIKFIEDHCYDGRRVWQLATVWFDTFPVMVIQNAGREGEDYSRRYVTNAERLSSLLNEVRDIYKLDEDKIEEVKPQEDIETLTNFYGHKLGDDF